MMMDLEASIAWLPTLLADPNTHRTFRSAADGSITDVVWISIRQHAIED
jgi:hypothetical protein